MDTYTDEKINVQFIFEDEQGSYSLFDYFSEIRLSIDPNNRSASFQKFDIKEDSIGNSNPGVFNFNKFSSGFNTTESGSISNNVIIVVFDLDVYKIIKKNKDYCNYRKSINKPVDEKYLSYETILFYINHFNGDILSKNSSHTDKYVLNSDNIVLIPTFFCAETLLLLIDVSYNDSITHHIDYDDYDKDTTKLVLPEVPELNVLAYDYFKNKKLIKLNKRLQGYYYDLYKYYLTAILEHCGLIDNDKCNLNGLTSKDIENKRTGNIINSMKQVKSNVRNDFLNCLKNYSILNFPFYEMLLINDDNSLLSFINKYKFSNYSNELKRCLDVYGDIIEWNPDLCQNYCNTKNSWYNRLYDCNDGIIANQTSDTTLKNDGV